MRPGGAPDHPEPLLHLLHPGLGELPGQRLLQRLVVRHLHLRLRGPAHHLRRRDRRRGSGGGGTDGGTGGTDGGSGGGGTGSLHVLFDDAHAEQAGNADSIIDSNMPTPSPSSPTAGTDWNGAYSSFGVALYKDGDTLETLPPGGQLTYGSGGAQDLSHFQVLVLPEPNDTLSASEIQAINRPRPRRRGPAGHQQSWQRRPGPLRGRRGADPRPLFASDSWGVHLDGSNFSGTVQATSGAAPMSRDPCGSVSTLGCWNGSTMTLDTSVNASVFELATLSGGTFDAAGNVGSGQVVGPRQLVDRRRRHRHQLDQAQVRRLGPHLGRPLRRRGLLFQNAVAWVGQLY